MSARTPQVLIPVALVALIILWGVAPAAAPPQAWPVVGWGDVVVATVTGVVSRHPPTNGQPPVVTLRIHEVLRGDPKIDRTTAVWGPGRGPLCGNDPGFPKWLATPLKPPAVGEKFLLWGYIDTPAKGKKPAFHTDAWGRFPDSPQKRRWAARVIDEENRQMREAREQKEAEERAFRNARTAWRAGVSRADLERFTARAEFVCLARRVSGHPLYEATKILKGTKRKEFAGGAYYVTVTFADRVEKRIDRETTFLLFLRYDGLGGHGGVGYAPIAGGDGVVIADREAIQAVERALKHP
jgi:hypothetical protein